MAGPGENPQKPIDPSRVTEQNVRALEKLQDAVEQLQKTLTSAQSGRVGALSGVVLPTGYGDDARKYQEQLQQQNEGGRPSQYASMASISFRQLMFGAKDAEGEKEGGFFNRNRKPGESRLRSALEQKAKGPTGGPSPYASDAGRLEAEQITPTEGGGYASEPPNTGPRSKLIPGKSEREVGQMLNEGFRIPQFGEWQLDTKLRMARDWLGQWANNMTPEGQDPTGLAKGLGGLSGLADYGQAHAAQIQVAKKAWQKLQGYGAGAAGVGAELGYSPQGGGLLGASNILGFRNPISYLASSAGKQGLGMNVDAYRMARLGTGLSLDQSRDIFSSLAGMGFSNQQSGVLGLTTGGDLQNIASGLVGPMVKQGFQPSVAASFAESLKTGNTSIQQLAESIRGLGGMAKDTRQTLSQATEGLQQYATTAVGLGASPVQAYRSGIGFANITGQNPMSAANLMNSPYFQGQAMATYGVLPGAIGTLPAAQLAKTQLDSVQKLERTFSGLKPIMENGKVVVSAEREREAYVAKELGITSNEVRMIKKKKGTLAPAALAEEALEPESTWNQAWAHMQGKAKTPILQARLREREKGLHSSMKRRNLPEKMKKLRSEYANEEGEFSREGWYAPTSHANEELLKHGGEFEGEHITGTLQMAEWLHKDKANKSQLQEFNKAKLQDKAKVGEKILGELGKPTVKNHGKETTVNGVTIGLTRQAQQLLKIEGPNSAERGAGAGGDPLTNQAVNPSLPEPTGGFE